VTDALKAYEQATILDPTWYKAWHSWALANSEVVSHYMKTRPESDTDPIPHEIFTGYLVPSVQGMRRFLWLDTWLTIGQLFFNQLRSRLATLCKIRCVY
jgi:hypothetical protein